MNNIPNSKHITSGKFCVFDYSLDPNQKDRAKELLDYFDRNWNPIFDFFEIKLPEFIVKAKFTPEGTGCSNETKELSYDIHNNRNNKGCLLHEITHFAQHYDSDIYQANYHLSEGIADYIRIKFAEDKVWDDPNDYTHVHSGKLFICSRCVGGFLIYIETKYKDARLQVDLNNALKTRTYSDLFLVKRFGESLKVLWEKFANLEI
jgi:hypothetical protein